MNMQKSNDLPDDPLPPFDAGGEPLVANDHLRKALLAQTLGILRRRRRLKRCALAASLLGCYLAGAVTMAALHTQAGHLPTTAPATEIVKSEKTTPSDRNTRHVVAKTPTGFESWRRIGDGYLRESGDVSLAVAGYSEAINLASTEERRISPERDNWLMMALKDARSKENSNAYP
jgi:hypothetical protein